MRPTSLSPSETTEATCSHDWSHERFVRHWNALAQCGVEIRNLQSLKDLKDVFEATQPLLNAPAVVLNMCRKIFCGHLRTPCQTKAPSICPCRRSALRSSSWRSSTWPGRRCSNSTGLCRLPTRCAFVCIPRQRVWLVSCGGTRTDNHESHDLCASETSKGWWTWLPEGPGTNHDAPPGLEEGGAAGGGDTAPKASHSPGATKQR